ncbi:MAG: hypothetical protein BMS9Abin29_1029 [Gemmatimonadota bacterium]|nr:MAG: hypothetical protein BMS9Abin29_1029 [Gemmatimonadota bacterium]
MATSSIGRNARLSRSFALAVLVALYSCGSGTTGPGGAVPGITPPAPDDLGVLFIGNSLTYWNDMPGLLEELLESANIGPVHIQSVAFSNFGLQDHWVEGTARSAIALGGWDVVILQQGPSATEGRPSLLEYAQRFAGEISAIGARPALYMVWPASTRPFDFDGVSDSYSTAAGLVEGLLFPAGEAWRSAWARDQNAPLYGPDGFHPALAGSYLAALVMYQQLADRDPRDVPPARLVADGINASLAEVLLVAAAEANELFQRPAP